MNERKKLPVALKHPPNSIGKPIQGPPLFDPYGLDWNWDENQPIRKLKKNPYKPPVSNDRMGKVWDKLKDGTTLKNFMAANAKDTGMATWVLKLGVMFHDLAIGDYIDKRYGGALQKKRSIPQSRELIHHR